MMSTERFAALIRANLERQGQPEPTVTDPAVLEAAGRLNISPSRLAYWLSFHGREYASVPGADPAARIVALYRSNPGV